MKFYCIKCKKYENKEISKGDICNCGNKQNIVVFKVIYQDKNKFETIKVFTNQDLANEQINKFKEKYPAKSKNFCIIKDALDIIVDIKLEQK